MPFKLAASAEMLFLDLPFSERVEIIHDQGFLVEIWNWANKDLDALSRTSARFQSMTGYLEGDLLEEDGIENLLKTALQSIEASKVISCDNLNIHGTGLDSQGQAIRKLYSTDSEQWKKAVATLSRLAELGEKHSKVFTLENLNLLVDHPGTPFAKASETRELVREVGSPNLRMNLDLYHAQIGEGNLAELIEVSLDYVAEIQVADVPGRMEPGTGEIHYAFLARRLQELGYEGVIGLEGFASGDSFAALESFRKAFTL
jgi:hydroxypyruvate isomerase